MPRAAIYTRLSKDRPEERSRADQESDCRALCAAKGYEVVETYTDLESGYRRNARRPGYEALLDDLAAGLVDVVVVWKLDRLTRQGIRQVGPLLDALDRAGATLVSVHDSIDTSTAMGEGVLGLLASMAKAESENISVRTRRAKLHHARNGRHRDGGPRAFGLTPDWATIVPEEAEAIREAAGRVIAGDSLRSIVLDWQARGIRTSTGREWSAQGLRQLLRQPRLCGQRVYAGQVVGEGGWPAILEAPTCARLRAVLDDPSRRQPGAGRHLLTGLLRCGKCGSRLRTSAPGGTRKYSCPPKPEGCNGVAIVAEPLEELVTEAVLLRLDSPALAVAMAEAAEGDDDAAEATVLQTRLDELADMFASGELSRREWLRAKEGVERRLEAAEAALRRHGASAALAGTTGELRATWPTLSADRRRAVLAAVVEAVTIAPAVKGRNRFDPERVDVVWRA
jgi:site-specific DNA recombinase